MFFYFYFYFALCWAVTNQYFQQQNGQPADCTYLSIRTAYVCGPIVGKYILHNESMVRPADQTQHHFILFFCQVVKVILTVNTNAIGYISHNVTFNISSQDASIAGKNNTIVITLDPVVSAILDVVSLYVIQSPTPPLCVCVCVCVCVCACVRVRVCMCFMQLHGYWQCLKIGRLS